jgi:tetratricopeptide (TPR) repeat protein
MKAIEYFQLAIETDPTYAAAYAGLADAYGQLAYWGFASPREVMPKVKAAMLKAVELDDTLGEAHSILGRLKFFYDWDWLAAEREFKRAIELNPNDTLARLSYSFELAVMGRPAPQCGGRTGLGKPAPGPPVPRAAAAHGASRD